MRSTLLAAGALAAGIFITPSVRAQEPVPAGEKRPSVEHAHRPSGPRVLLRGSDGKVLSSASILVRNVATKELTLVKTSAAGEAVLPTLDPGEYEVTTRTPGRPALTKLVTIPTGGTASYLFSIGPVPAGEPQPPAPDPPPAPTPLPAPAPVPDGEPSTPGEVAVSVEEKAFADDVSLLSWLAGKKAGRLVAVLPISAGTSLFAFRTEAAEALPGYTVFHAAEPLSAHALETRLALQKSRPFLGVHLLGPSAYLLVYADER